MFLTRADHNWGLSKRRQMFGHMPCTVDASQRGRGKLRGNEDDGRHVYSDFIVGLDSLLFLGRSGDLLWLSCI
jgi:hypothetical protein